MTIANSKCIILFPLYLHTARHQLVNQCKDTRMYSQFLMIYIYWACSRSIRLWPVSLQ